jgi:hypothetical protein
MIKEVAGRELQGIPSFSVVAVSLGAGKDHATAVKERYRPKQKHFGSLLTTVELGFKAMWAITFNTIRSFLQLRGGPHPS